MAFRKSSVISPSAFGSHSLIVSKSSRSLSPFPVTPFLLYAGSLISLWMLISNKIFAKIRRLTLFLVAERPFLGCLGGWFSEVKDPVVEHLGPAGRISGMKVLVTNGYSVKIRLKRCSLTLGRRIAHYRFFCKEMHFLAAPPISEPWCPM